MTYTKKRGMKYKRKTHRKRRRVSTRRKRKSLSGGLDQKVNPEILKKQVEDSKKEPLKDTVIEEEDEASKEAKKKAATQERCRKKKWNNFIIIDGKKQVNDECWNPINQVGWYTHILNNNIIYRHRLKTGWPRWEIFGREGENFRPFGTKYI
jgi:hypothetical protein